MDRERKGVLAMLEPLDTEDYIDRVRQCIVAIQQQQAEEKRIRDEKSARERAEREERLNKSKQHTSMFGDSATEKDKEKDYNAKAQARRARREEKKRERKNHGKRNKANKNTGVQPNGAPAEYQRTNGASTPLSSTQH